MELRALLEMRQALPLSFSDDGSSLLVASNVSGTQQLQLVPPRGGELRPLTDFAEPVSGQFLPDGRILLEMDERGNERTQLYLLDAEPGAEPVPLVVDPRFMHDTPHVGRGGALIAYRTNRRNGRDFDVVARTLPGGEERSLELGGWCAVAGISPDGRWIVVEQLGERASDSDLFLWEVDTGEVVHATPHGDEAEYLRAGLARGLVGVPRGDERGPRHVRDLPLRSRVPRLARPESSPTGTSTASATRRGGACS